MSRRSARRRCESCGLSELSNAHLRTAPIQFRRSIEGLQDEWQGWTYDLLSRNCNHFCEALVEILGVGPLPGACENRAFAHAQRASFAAIVADSLCASAWVNRFAVNADYALETSQTALTEVKKIWKNSADTLTLATGWLKDHLTIGVQGLCLVCDFSLTCHHRPCIAGGATAVWTAAAAAAAAEWGRGRCRAGVDTASSCHHCPCYSGHEQRLGCCCLKRTGVVCN